MTFAENPQLNKSEGKSRAAGSNDEALGQRSESQNPSHTTLTLFNWFNYVNIVLF